jgi:hypothetical protein
MTLYKNENSQPPGADRLSRKARMGSRDHRFASDAFFGKQIGIEGIGLPVRIAGCGATRFGQR